MRSEPVTPPACSAPLPLLHPMGWIRFPRRRVLTESGSPKAAQWHPQPYLRARPRLALDPELAAQSAGPLAHALQPNPGRPADDEAAPVVGDLRHQVLPSRTYGNDDLARPGVAPGVRQRLAQDAKHLHAPIS